MEVGGGDPAGLGWFYAQLDVSSQDPQAIYLLLYGPLSRCTANKPVEDAALSLYLPAQEDNHRLSSPDICSSLRVRVNL